MPSKFPEVEVGDYKFTKIILGLDPFQGYTLFYPNPNEKLKIYQNRFSDPTKIVDIISVLVEGGVRSICFKRIGPLVKAARLVEEKNKFDLDLIPSIYLIPLMYRGKPISSNRIESTVLKYRVGIKENALYKEYICTRDFEKISSAKPLQEEECEKVEVDYQRLRNMLKWYDAEGCVKLIRSNLEFFTLASRFDLLDEANKVFDEFGFSICAGSHLATVFDILKSEGFKFPAYFAPLNKIGFCMFPSFSSMVSALSKIDKPLMIIKPLAGGRLSPLESFESIFSLKKNVACIVGISSIREAKKTLKAAQKTLYSY